MSPKRLNLPDTASLTTPGDGGKLHAPSAERNVEAIVETVLPLLPATGAALEIASGTGQHIVRLAAAAPAIEWHPSDIDADRLTSIRAWRSEAGLANIAAPILLDATVPGWSGQVGRFEVIYLSNLLHLISASEARTLIAETANTLTPDGVSLIYGPFKRGEDFAGEGDRRFHESLTSQDPEIGYKSFQWVQDAQVAAGLSVRDPITMPANNLILVAQKT